MKEASKPSKPSKGHRLKGFEAFLPFELSKLPSKKMRYELVKVVGSCVVYGENK